MNHLCWWSPVLASLLAQGSPCFRLPSTQLAKKRLCLFPCKAFPSFRQVNKEARVSQLRLLHFSGTRSISEFMYFCSTALGLPDHCWDEAPNTLTHGCCPHFHPGFYGNRQQLAQNKVRAERHLTVPRHIQTIFARYHSHGNQERSIDALQ